MPDPSGILKKSTLKTPPNNTIPVRERVYEHIKASILSGHLNPGEKLTEEHLAKTLGVSRTPVREALHKLDSEGLIKVRKKRGFVVSRDSKEEVEELFELRSILEGYALRVISETVLGETLRRPERFIQNAEEALKRKKCGCFQMISPSSVRILLKNCSLCVTNWVNSLLPIHEGVSI
jgi:DNA-binding GntR family transcriptional regulator